MNIVDSSGWIEYVTDSSNATIFEAPITRSDDLLIPTCPVPGHRELF
jgi:hypothetical protein